MTAVDAPEPGASEEPGGSDSGRQPAPPVPPAPPSLPANSNAGWIRPLVAIAVFTLILTVASAVAVLSPGGPTATTYPPGSPQEAFQRFVAAAKNNDWTTADSLLSSDLKTLGLSPEAIAGPAQGTGTVSIDGVTFQDSSHVYLNVTYHFSDGTMMRNDVSGAPVLMVLEPGGWKVGSELNYDATKRGGETF